MLGLVKTCKMMLG